MPAIRLPLCLIVGLLPLLAGLSAGAEPLPPGRQAIVNPAINQVAYLNVASEAIAYRATRRVSEADFIRMSQEPGTVILDARSKPRFDELHVRGAFNLSFPDLTVASLAAALPDKNTRILIYCNNNFSNDERAFPAKLVSASLNVPTYIALYDYGYRNVYELGPLLDVRTTRIPLEATPEPVPGVATSLF